MNFSFVLTILAFVVTCNLQAAVIDSVSAPLDTTVITQTTTTDSIDGTRLAVVLGGTAAAFTVGHVWLNETWWKGEYSPFHVNCQQDYEYALNADKLGHMSFAYAATTIYGAAFRWTGMDSSRAIWWAAGVSLAYQTYVEIRDGFSKDYGFSWGDIAANTVGSALPVAQHYLPALRPFEFQFSFWPSEAYRRGEYGAIIDDYTSTYHWLAANVYDLLPATWQHWYPPWLGVSIGHSVENVDGFGGGNHALYLSLDWQLHRINGLPDWLSSVLRFLHLYHLPAPAVKVLPNVVWYGLRF